MAKGSSGLGKRFDRFAKLLSDTRDRVRDQITKLVVPPPPPSFEEYKTLAQGKNNKGEKQLVMVDKPDPHRETAAEMRLLSDDLVSSRASTWSQQSLTPAERRDISPAVLAARRKAAERVALLEMREPLVKSQYQSLEIRAPQPQRIVAPSIASFSLHDSDAGERTVGSSAASQTSKSAWSEQHDLGSAGSASSVSGRGAEPSRASDLTQEERISASQAKVVDWQNRQSQIENNLGPVHHEEIERPLSRASFAGESPILLSAEEAAARLHGMEAADHDPVADAYKKLTGKSMAEDQASVHAPAETSRVSTISDPSESTEIRDSIRFSQMSLQRESYLPKFEEAKAVSIERFDLRRQDTDISVETHMSAHSSRAESDSSSVSSWHSEPEARPVSPLHEKIPEQERRPVSPLGREASINHDPRASIKSQSRPTTSRT